MIHGHGGNIFAVAAQLGCAPEEIIDMSSNINPLGAMPGLLDYLRRRLERIQSLPDVDAEAAVRGLSALLDLEPDCILAGAGTTQFIYSACAALNSKKVLIIGPSYADYADACRMQGLEPDFFLSQAQDGFQPVLTELSPRLRHYDTVFLCNPNNPSGQFIARQELLALCDANPRIRWIIDESYLPFAAEQAEFGFSRISLERDNMLILWSVSKIFAIPGLRSGFLLARPGLLACFKPLMQPWSVNSMAQEALRYLGEHRQEAAAFINRTRAFIQQESSLLHQRLSETGLRILPSHTSYHLIQLPPPHQANEVYEALKQQRILIRNCANFHGLNQSFIRVALKDASANQRLAKRLAIALENKCAR